MLDEKYMRFAIQLAEQMKGQTTPNPPVGAVVVNNQTIVGFGAHMTSGEAHAEVIALEMAGENARGSTVYVTLEPCTHFGKTAPCADLLIEKQVKKVVIACIDVHDKVAGEGVAKLKDAGIEVETGYLRQEAIHLYDVFFYSITSKLPFVTVKTAVSLDGKTATVGQESKWITNKTARLDAHLYRHQHDAILVGVNTVIKDNPKLTTRIPGGRNPIRIILDTHLRTPTNAKIVTDGEAETWIFIGKRTPSSKLKKFTHSFVRIFQMEDETLEMRKVLEILSKENVSSLFVEGGATINGSLLKEKLINQLIIYMAPILIGGKDAPGPFGGEGFHHLRESYHLQISEITQIDDQIKIVAKKEDMNVHGNCRGKGSNN
ncbi:bifunctional diaminohydroxyphosphoribosylaminopyrimidine deaminase/5-amino-6-(5-phosphoribosylamino)uracil reductase RibD [Pseudogracilibacillus sp. SE30717A]|uniref:bifunctional diaminohydroxyphosphoribosylaminopyrimidine deaminase/5-amino-6-(5-phosphoribosylamino)uracil reductase RibD n=1 Tax=Pseudogracilibacillus sp. SE30717A TaxID=3098293 RepID=UPI00300E53CC